MNNLLWRRGTGFTALSALFLYAAFPLLSHDPITTKLTWSREISRIVHKRCAGCHLPGGPAFSLITFDDARPWAKAIRDEVTSRRMPPWGAVQGVRAFVGDPSLSTPEIDMLVAWVEGGAPEGDPAFLPKRIPEALQRTAKREPHDLPVPAPSRALRVSTESVLSRPQTLIALRPEHVAEKDSIEAWAVKPDGSVERLIWLRDYRKSWPRNYVLREPLTLPAHTRLRVQAAPSAALLFYLRAN